MSQGKFDISPALYAKADFVQQPWAGPRMALYYKRGERIERLIVEEDNYVPTVCHCQDNKFRSPVTTHTIPYCPQFIQFID